MEGTCKKDTGTERDDNDMISYPRNWIPMWCGTDENTL
jgi:hypothetical protein